ncbi:MAG: hypothetical protein MJA27_19860 [Pseudanabaenales cyanobacterium]|nr:hypothetical protein [Pseudanabaenales cyanobacterium]
MKVEWKLSAQSLGRLWIDNISAPEDISAPRSGLTFVMMDLEPVGGNRSSI